MKSLKRRLSTLAALACLFYSNGALRANDVRWAGNPDLNDDNWTDYGNWNNRTRPDSTSTTRVFFGDNVGRANSNQDLGNFYSLGQIIFDATSTNYNIFGESISLYSGIFVNGSSSQHISFDMAMQNDVTM